MGRPKRDRPGVQGAAGRPGTAQPPEAGPLAGGLSQGYGGSVLPPWAAGSPLAREYFLRMDPLPLYQ